MRLRLTIEIDYMVPNEVDVARFADGMHEAFDMGEMIKYHDIISASFPVEARCVFSSVGVIVQERKT